MNIVVLCKNDFAGNMYNLCTAVNKHTNHDATVINSRNAGYNYPTMITQSNKNLNLIQEKICDADVIIFKESHKIPTEFKINLKELGDKPILVLFGGRGFRHETLRNLSIATYNNLSNIKWTVTTCTFLEKYPEWTWIPRCIRFEELRRKYDYRKQEPPLIVTSPSTGSNENFNTIKQFKHITSALKNHKFKTRIIFNADNSKCLRLKAPASIFFDRIGYTYGINSLEAGAFESAVVTEVPRFAQKKLKEYGFNCPFINVTNIKEAINSITELLKDEEYRTMKSLECFKYVEQVHSGKESVKRLIALIEEMK